ncbi:MAG: sodium/proline symporter [Rhabdochlamydiaceae bacterium]
MYFFELSAIIIYFLCIVLIGWFSSKKNLTSSDFLMGGRSLNYWLTALAAHASDMSSWLFMGYPSLVYLGGLRQSWAAIGLVFFMYLNWQFIAPKIRVYTEKYDSLTFSSFFESHTGDRSGLLRLITALMCLIFYSIYISASLVGLGTLLNTLFSIPFPLAICLGIALTIPYILLGGFLTLAWIDLFQGLFLMIVILIVPFHFVAHIGGWDTLLSFLDSHSFQIVDNASIASPLLLMLGWGLGYFGQPHIITKFMGIKNVKDIPKSKYIGMSWMILSLSAATLIGLVATAFFKSGLKDSELVFIEMVKQLFHPFWVGFVLCAIFAATINAMSSQVLVLSSTITEDFYKRFINKQASPAKLVQISRLGILFIAFSSFWIALLSSRSVYHLVLYAWSGLGSTFGPLLIACLYKKRVSKYAAFLGILIGGVTSLLWPLINPLIYEKNIPSIIPGFFTGLCFILIGSILIKKR